MADLELAETSETGPSPLIPPPRPGFFPLGGPRPNFLSTAFVSPTKAIRRRSSLVVPAAYGPKPIVRLCEGPIGPDAHAASLCASRDRLAKALGGSGFYDGELLAEDYSASLRALPDQLAKALSGSGVHDGDLLKDLKFVGIVHERLPSSGALIPPPKVVSYPDALVEPPYASRKDHVLAKFLASTIAIDRPKTFVPLRGASFLRAAYIASPLAGCLLAAILFSQGDSSGSGGRAREGRNGGGGNGNQGILVGGVGGGGVQREGIGNERRGNRGSNRGGGNGSGDDDGNGRGALVDFIDGEYSLAKILLFLVVQMLYALVSLDIHGLPARAMIYRLLSLAFNSGAFVSLSASIRQRRTNPRLATILSWIGSFATLLGFISLIIMAISASFIP